MMVNPASLLRGFLAVTVILSIILVVNAYEPNTVDDKIFNQQVEPRDGITVITTDHTGDGRIIAFAENGSILYYNDTNDHYWDVDPAPEGKYTVEYVTGRDLSKSECHTETACRISIIERVNLSTGRVTEVWSSIRPKVGSSEIHDADRISENEYIIAEISQPDSVYIVNTSTGLISWEWQAQSDFPLSGGGSWPTDWTHLNDVEMVNEKLVMVSLRNQDQVVFINLDTGLVPNMTLGSDDRRTLLFEQHNPDIIRDSNGGYSIIVSDSENNRVMEFDRHDGEWERVWIWQDHTMQWPRDADRLPNGNTLITDTHADRVIEINPQGQIIWQVYFPGPYEAERINTLDESGDGVVADEAGLKSNRLEDSVVGGTQRERVGKEEQLRLILRPIVNLLPSYLVNGLLFWLPKWFDPGAALGLVGFVFSVLTLGVFELYNRYRIEFYVGISRK